MSQYDIRKTQDDPIRADVAILDTYDAIGTEVGRRMETLSLDIESSNSVNHTRDPLFFSQPSRSH